MSKDVSPSENVTNMTANIHLKLHDERVVAGQTGGVGPRVLVVGTPGCGKSTMVRTLASYATRMGDQPVVVNLNPEEGMLTLGGTLSAAVFASIMDVESRSKWGTSPASGPSTVPPKIPLAQYYGHSSPTDDPAVYRDLVTALAATVTERLANDSNVKKAGMIVDTAGVDPRDKASLALLNHIISEFTSQLAPLYQALTTPVALC